MNLITGRTGTKHVLARHDALIYRTSIADGDFVLPFWQKLTCTPTTATSVSISSGCLLMQGRLCEIPSGTTETVSNIPVCSATTLNKINILTAKYTIDTNGIESVVLEVIEGQEASNTPPEPTLVYANGDIDSGEIHQMPLYKINVEGMAISSVTPMFTIFDSGSTHPPKYSVVSIPSSTTTSSTLTIVSSQISSDYTYAETDYFEVFLNGLKLTKNEVTVTGSTSNNSITLTFPSNITLTTSDVIEVIIHK